MLIRKMTIDDYEGVYALWISAPGLGLNEIDDSREGLGKYLRRNPATCFVAGIRGEIVGVILSGHDGRRGYVHHAAVSAAHRGKGIGSALVDAAVKALQKEGIRKVALVVFKRNESGNAFWEKRGFLIRDDLHYRNKSLSD